jgi:hypothetical protein
MTGDVRRFLAHKWSLIECPNEAGVDLVREWRDRYRGVPAWGFGAVAGWHFRIGDEVRGVKLTRPDVNQVPEPVLARVCTVIGAKHRVAEVRLAHAGEIPDLGRADLLPQPSDRHLVEEWPPEHARIHGPLVAELQMPPGRYLAESWQNVTDSLEEALEFTDVEDAEQYLAALSPQIKVLLRFKVGAQAEADQRDQAELEGRQVW